MGLQVCCDCGHSLPRRGASEHCMREPLWSEIPLWPWLIMLWRHLCRGRRHLLQEPLWQQFCLWRGQLMLWGCVCCPKPQSVRPELIGTRYRLQYHCKLVVCEIDGCHRHLFCFYLLQKIGRLCDVRASLCRRANAAYAADDLQWFLQDIFAL